MLQAETCRRRAAGRGMPFLELLMPRGRDVLGSRESVGRPSRNQTKSFECIGARGCEMASTTVFDRVFGVLANSRGNYTHEYDSYRS